MGKPEAGPCQVETYSGGRLHERPRRFTRGGRWLEVLRVLSRRREPDHLRFRVLAADHRVYLLSYDLRSDAWEVEPAEARGPDYPG